MTDDTIPEKEDKAMTKYYGDDKETDRAVETLISREVLVCQSTLVEALLDMVSDRGPQASGDLLGGFEFEAIQNLYPDPSEWTDQECRDWCEEHGVDMKDEECLSAVIENAESAEIFEWWLVTTWAAGALREQNEPILAVGDDIWWGRTCTGQSIALDPTWYDIYEGIQP